MNLLTDTPSKNENKVNRETQENVTYDIEKSSADTEIAEVATSHSPTEKYILCYDEKTDSIMIITLRKDGSRIISPAEEIIPEYLTEEARQALIKGIEFTNKEDLYVLIEDYSS